MLNLLCQINQQYYTIQYNRIQYNTIIKTFNLEKDNLTILMIPNEQNLL
jgi:hypothetical protein